MTLTEFLLARIAEDEAVPEELRRPNAGDPWGWQPSSHPPVLAHGTARIEFTPARVLAECEAKRRIVARHYRRPPVCAGCMDEWPCPDLRDLAGIYADHPDYREEWRP